MAFNSPEGDLEQIYLDDYVLIDRFAAKGSLWSWGRNTNGQLGTNDIVHRSSPIQTVAGGTNWKQMSCGDNHTAAIKTDGTLWLWGLATSGQLGNNAVSNRSSPVQTISGGTNWEQVACGGSYSAAIKTDGTLWTWGINTYGQLGTNNITNLSSPVQTVSGGTNWGQVSVGATMMGAIKTDGTLWMWGRNNFGQLGTNDVVHRSSPVQTISGGTNWKSVACGGNHTAAIKTDGTLWLWGYGVYGQLGNNARTPRSSPIQTISAGTNWKLVACGGNHTAAIKTDGTLWLWGNNYTGELGDNTRNHRSSPVQTISGGTNWKDVSGGSFDSTAAIKTDGTLWTWGQSPTLGDNTLVDKSSPVQTIAAGTNWKQVSCGSIHTSAVFV